MCYTNAHIKDKGNMGMKKRKTILLIFIIIIALVATGAYFYIKYQTYDYMQMGKTYENSNADNAQYAWCLDGVLRYSRDGIALYDVEARELWKQPCQMIQDKRQQILRFL